MAFTVLEKKHLYFEMNFQKGIL